MGNKCPNCKGTGKVEITVRNWGDPKPTQVTILNCYDCDGTGEVDQAELEAYNYEKNMWCKCKKSPGSHYVKDNVHARVTKHHWRCDDCNKVTQVG